MRELIRAMPDYPVPGVTFRDITPLLADAAALAEAVAGIAAPFEGHGIDTVVGIEARGFILAAPVALHLGAGFVPVRKPGKLPWQTVSETYELEYGTDALEMHVDGVRPDSMVLVVDDVLATGGTAGATVRLIQKAGADVAGFGFLIELDFLGGRSKLPGVAVHSLIRYT